MMTMLSEPIRAIARDAREAVNEEAEFRELLYQMTVRDLRLRYKQTAMGFGWALLAPLLNTVMFSVIFMRVAPIQTRVPYPLFAYCGLLAWNFTASALRFAVSSLTANTTLVTKVYFPREMFPFSAVAVSLVDYAVGATLLVAMLAYYHVVPGTGLLLLPAILAVHVAFTAALALLLAMANLFYRDVKYLFDVFLMVWMFASATVYPSEAMGRGVLGWIVRTNPMTVIIEAYRDVFLYGSWPAPAPFVGVAAATFIFLPAVWLTFHRMEFQFAERI
jgi:ABC-type polysaccharide/polyol phosphate export permease